MIDFTSEDIDIIFADIDSNGYYLNINNMPTIVINKNLSENEERFTIAEELAHHKVGVIPNLPFSTDYYNMLIRSKNEFNAFKWMQANLLPLGIENEKIDTLWELSDRLGLPMDFIEKAIEYRKENNK